MRPRAAGLRFPKDACVVIDGVFAPTATAGAFLHSAVAIDRPAIATVQAKLRRRLLASFVRRGLLADADARAMAQWDHGGGCSVDATARIEVADRAGRERRLRELGLERLDYDRRQPSLGSKGPLIVTPFELLDRLASLVPPADTGDARYFGNSSVKMSRAPQPCGPPSGDSAQ